MKSILPIIATFFILFLSCDSNDSVNQECFSCEYTATTYCISQGDDFYTVTVADASETIVPLDGAYWSDIRIQLEEACTIAALTDCYTCTDTQTEYCYFQDALFYTATQNGEETQIELGNQTWEEIKAYLQGTCISDFSSLVGNWKITDFHGTISSTVTLNGQSTTTTSEQHATTLDAFVEFTENPNNYLGNGFITIQMTLDNGTISTYESTPFESGTWQQNGNQLELDSDPNNTATILQLSETTLELHFVQQTSSTDNTTGAVTETNLDFYQTYQRQ